MLKFSPMFLLGVIFQFLAASIECQDLARPRIQSLLVRSDIQSRFATTLVTSKILNPNPEPLEVEFTVILPNAAFINNFTMLVDGELIVGDIQEKEKAKKQYEAAKSRGETAGLVAQKPRETNQFSTSVNVAANAKAEFNLTYQEVLQRVLGVYKHTVNISPGQIVEDMAIEVFITEAREITSLVVPKIEEKIGEKTNKELISLTSDPSISILKQPLTDDGIAKAHISYPISKKQQKDFSKDTGINGQLVVLYDVARSKDAGEIQVVDGYFVHFFAPSDLPIAPKHVVFTLDDSGSMSGDKIEQLKEAMRVILNDLNEGDYFNIVRFDDETTKWLEESVVATEDNKMKAIEFTNNLEADGGTEIQKSLRLSIDHLVNSKVGVNLPRMIVFLTDGIAFFSLEEVKKQNLEADVVIHAIAFGDDAEFDKLTSLAIQNDGVPRKVYTGADATLQLTGFYDEIASPLLLDVDIKYVNRTVDPRSLIQNKEGTYYDGSEMVVVGKIKNSPSLFNKVDKSFQITGIISCFDVDGPVTFDVRRPVTCSEFCFGPLARIDSGFSPSLRCPPSCLPEITPAPLSDPKSVGGFIERMWAYLTIKKLLDQAKYKEDNTQKQEKLKAKALKLSLKYNFVTELTSMVVTKPDGKSDPLVDSETDDNRRSQNAPLALGSSPLRSRAFAATASLKSSSKLRSNSGLNSALPAAVPPLPLSEASFIAGTFPIAEPFPFKPTIDNTAAGASTAGEQLTPIVDGSLEEDDEGEEEAEESSPDDFSIVENEKNKKVETERRASSAKSLSFKTGKVEQLNSTTIEGVKAGSRLECASLCFRKKGCSMALFNPSEPVFKCQLGSDAGLKKKDTCAIFNEVVIPFRKAAMIYCIQKN